MIAGMRQFARSPWALVIVFIPLVIGLALFLPDNFGSGGLSGGTLSKIGDREVKVQQVELDVQRMLEQVRRQENRVITPADAVRENRVQQIIQDLEIRNTLLAYADKVGIRASDASIRPYLQRNNLMLDEFGQLSRDAFAFQARELNLTAREFEAYIRDFLTQDYIREAAGSALTVPDVLSQPWINYNGESRTISLAQVTAATAPEPAEPTEAELQAWYDSHKASFEQPERRRISVLTYSPDDFLDKVELTDEQVRARYQERIKEYSTPETRTVVEFTSDSRSAVQDFVDLTAQGIPLEEALAQSPGLVRTESSVKPADIENQQYSAFLFSLPVGRVHNAPIQIEEGEPWKAILIASSTPGVPTPYEEIADKVRRDVAWPDAQILFENSSEPFRDAAGGGLPLEEVAKQFGIPLITLAPIDAQARTAQGAQAQIMAQNIDAMRQMFTLEAGNMTNVFEGEDVRSMFRLDEIIPPSTTPFADVKDRVRNALMTEKAIAARRAAADGMVAAVKAGTAFEKAAADARLTALPALTVVRAGNPPVDPVAVAGAFALKAGEISVVSGRDGNPWVARVDKIEPVAPEVALGLRAQLGSEMTQSLLRDLNEVFVRGLRAEVDYQRDDAAIETYLKRLVGDDTTQ